MPAATRSARHVCFLDPLEDRIKDFPGQYLAEHRVSYANGQPTDVPGDAEALITWSGLVDRDLIARLPKLRLVQRIGFFRGGGDLQAAADRASPSSVGRTASSIGSPCTP